MKTIEIIQMLYSDLLHIYDKIIVIISMNHILNRSFTKIFYVNTFLPDILSLVKLLFNFLQIKKCLKL